MRLLLLIGFVLINAWMSTAQTKDYYHLEGHINGRKIGMELIKRKAAANNPTDNYFGSFYYLDEMRPFIGYINTYNTQYFEFFFNDKINDREQKFIGQFVKETYSGIWTNGKDSFSFQVKETIPAVPLELLSNDVYKEHTIFPSIKSSMEYHFFYPKNDKAALDTFFQRYLIELSTSNFVQATTQEFQSYLISREELLISQKKSIDNGDPDPPYSEMLSYSMYPVINANGILVMNYNSYYIGYRPLAEIQDVYFNYDSKAKRWIAIEEVIDRGQEQQLVEIINKEIRKVHQFDAAQPLNEANPDLFITDQADFTDNFLITKKGILFDYNGGQLTNPFYGSYRVLIPFEILKPVLNPSFQWK